MNDRAPVTPMSLERLHVVLDAYGGSPERWPWRERAALVRLIEQSFVARELWRDARALDETMDALPPDDPSAELVARVLAGAPRGNPRRRWRTVIALAAPLAAAAALVLWATVTVRKDAVPVARGPAAQASNETSVVALGDYGGPTDVLLGGFVAQFADGVPAVGCADGALGCVDLDDGDELSQERRRRGGVA